MQGLGGLFNQEDSSATKEMNSTFKGKHAKAGTTARPPTRP